MMYQNGTEAVTDSSIEVRSELSCPHAVNYTWDLQETIVLWGLIAIVSIASPVIILLNALLIICVKHAKELQRNSNIMLSSMAVADLLAGVTSIPISVTLGLLVARQVSLERVCVLNKVNRNLAACFTFSSLYHLTVVAWERYVAVRKWKDYKVIVTRIRLKKLAITTWLLAIFTAVPVGVMDLAGVDSEVLKTWIIIANLCGAVCFIIILVFYAMVYLGVRKRNTSEIRQITSTLIQAKLESKVAKTTGLITATLIFTIVLGGVLFSVREVFPAFSDNQMLVHISGPLLLLNSLINPLLYFYRHDRFRRAVLELLRIRKPQATQPTFDAVRFRRQQNRLGSLDEREVKTVEKRSRLTRSVSCDLAVVSTDEMMLKRSSSVPSLLKYSSDDLELRKSTSIVITTATIHVERNVRYNPKEINPVSPGEDVNTRQRSEDRATESVKRQDGNPGIKMPQNVQTRGLLEDPKQRHASRIRP